ncbi:hypothetical protein U1Q18_047915, partial [Sarracenia purpurea var. burkii]
LPAVHDKEKKEEDCVPEEGEAMITGRDEATDDQAIDGIDYGFDEVEPKIEISDIMVRTAEHEIGLAVQKFQNMKDTQNAQIRARRGRIA